MTRVMTEEKTEVGKQDISEAMTLLWKSAGYHSRTKEKNIKMTPASK